MFSVYYTTGQILPKNKNKKRKIIWLSGEILNNTDRTHGKWK